MRKILLIAVAALTLGTAPIASAAVWMRTASDTAQEIEQFYAGVKAVRCFALGAAFQAKMGAVSQVYGGNREWNVFDCIIGFTNQSWCLAYAHITGQAYGAITLSAAASHSCTPFELQRLAKPSETPYQ